MVTHLLLGEPRGSAARRARRPCSSSHAGRAAGRNLARADQERPLAGLRGLGSDACALAIASGDPDLALSLLEQGRGILLQQAADGRADLTELAGTRADTWPRNLSSTCVTCLTPLT